MAEQSNCNHQPKPEGACNSIRHADTNSEDNKTDDDARSNGSDGKGKTKKLKVPMCQKFWFSSCLSLSFD